MENIEELIAAYTGKEIDPYVGGGTYQGPILQIHEGHFDPVKSEKSLLIHGTWYRVGGVVIDPITFLPMLSCHPWGVSLDLLSKELKKQWSIK